ncbi:hypothetical protein AAA799N04_01503 [Marine Group I thaumarchaeote SCGC AAA799-N04]|uniref:Uncharacterized protein n=1 Tax=Marine Group I thaumarchaeote SCGC AAA799-N04 TaxID=1502293 RepID=A0A081RLJ8_9ARCH|nr:hypothetical protein AAA799N04_01503 [Marine Group I thaumarchaeote SCGC AAA799-N04]
MNYSKLCSLILGLESQIRSVYVYHNNGELLAGGMRDEVMSLLPQDELTKSIHNTLLRWKTRELLYPFLGTGKYSLTEYEKVKRITFPLKNFAVIVVGMETTVHHNIIIEKILQLIEKF